MFSLTKRTLPSDKRMFTPPTCLLDTPDRHVFCVVTFELLGELIIPFPLNIVFQTRSVLATGTPRVPQTTAAPQRLPCDISHARSLATIVFDNPSVISRKLCETLTSKMPLDGSG